ncbi:MAG: acyl-CoA dehydrogenase family protein, partial [Granulicella sp.]
MFGLSEEQLQLQREVRTFAAREIAPHVSEWDETSTFPSEIIKKLGAMGLLGVIFPESLGGAGLGYVEYVLAIEELSRVDGSVGMIVAAHNSLCTNHIMLGGNDEQRQRW